MEASETLVQLERIMNEFFGVTSNDRKREIELLLSSFSNQDSSWRECLGFLAATQNQYVSMYSLTTIEKVICKRWVGMQGMDKTEIRTKLNEFLLKNHRTAPGFVIKKVIKLIVDIASTDWPHFYPDFFSNIMECIYRHDTLVLGLNMLLITSEELATPRDNVSSARKEELRRLLCAQVPQANNFLEYTYKDRLNIFLKKLSFLKPGFVLLFPRCLVSSESPLNYQYSNLGSLRHFPCANSILF